MKITLSTIILNYNTRELLWQCLNSLIANCKLQIDKGEYEIIVVDNGSKDGSVEEVKSLTLRLRSPRPELGTKAGQELRVIENKENLGFAKGNNVALRQTQGRYILLLNSDTIVEKETLPVMAKFMEENPKVGVATCRVELPDRALDPACHRGFPTPWASLTYFLGCEKIFPGSKIFGQYHQTYKDLTTTHEIDSPSGAFYLVRRKTIDEVGLLDEDYFMYGEDLDWSYRIKEAGWKIMYVPQVKITHLKRQSGRENISREERRKATDYFYSTMKLFCDKHFKDKYPFFVNWLMKLGINLKWWLSRT